MNMQVERAIITLKVWALFTIRESEKNSEIPFPTHQIGKNKRETLGLMRMRENMSCYCQDDFICIL